MSSKYEWPRVDSTAGGAMLAPPLQFSSTWGSARSRHEIHHVQCSLTIRHGHSHSHDSQTESIESVLVIADLKAQTGLKWRTESCRGMTSRKEQG